MKRDLIKWDANHSIKKLIEELYQIVNDMWTDPYDSSDYDLGIEKGINIAIEKLEEIIND